MPSTRFAFAAFTHGVVRLLWNDSFRRTGAFVQGGMFFSSTSPFGSNGVIEDGLPRRTWVTGGVITTKNAVAERKTTRTNPTSVSGFARNTFTRFRNPWPAAPDTIPTDFSSERRSGASGGPESDDSI